MRETEAEYPDGVTASDHIAHDMRMGRFPKQSSVETFLAETDKEVLRRIMSEPTFEAVAIAARKENAKRKLVAAGFDGAALAMARAFAPEMRGKESARLQIALFDAFATTLAAIEAEEPSP